MNFTLVASLHLYPHPRALKTTPVKPQTPKHTTQQGALLRLGRRPVGLGQLWGIKPRARGFGSS